MRLAAAAAAVLSLVTASPLAASAAESTRQPTALLPTALLPTAVLPVGADVSYPQKDGPYPAGQRFGLVGVNDGQGTHSNPYFAEQLAWAQASAGGTRQPTVGLYVNTANPSAKDAHWWPSSDRTRSGVAVTNPYGHCRSKADSTACSYVYGYSIAEDDFTIRGPQHGERYRWWLDVEVANDWSGSTGAHVANLEGMADALASHGAASGVYASRRDFARIVGTPSRTSALSFMPSWIAGGSITHAQAQAACEKPGLTDYGRYALVQYVSRGQDYDVSCSTFPSSPRPTVTGTVRLGHTLTARTGVWGTGGIRFAYRWNRSGTAIGGATGRTHVVTKADVGRTLTVTVTATKAGYNGVSVTSTAQRAHAAQVNGVLPDPAAGPGAATTPDPFDPGALRPPVPLLPSGGR